MSISLVCPSPRALTPAQFGTLADNPPEIEWFANLTNANTRRAYRQDINDFMAFAGLRHPEQFRHIMRACHRLAGPGRATGPRERYHPAQAGGAVLALRLSLRPQRRAA
jgi:hypothetical protein